MFEQNLLLVLMIIALKIFLTDCTMKDWKIEKSKIDVNLKYQMQMVNKFPFSLNRLLIKSQFIFVPLL